MTLGKHCSCIKVGVTVTVAGAEVLPECVVSVADGV